MSATARAAWAITGTNQPVSEFKGMHVLNHQVDGTLLLNGDTKTSSNVGTAGTGVTAVERGNGDVHTTILTLSGVDITIGDNASLADGSLIYTFPAGPIAILAKSMSLGLSLTTGTPTTDTPEIALGTTLASGANATLGAVAATAENILGPAVMDDIAGTAELLTSAAAFVMETAAAHTVYANVADAWADVDDTAATLDGTVTLVWCRVPLS